MCKMHGELLATIFKALIAKININIIVIFSVIIMMLMMIVSRTTVTVTATVRITTVVERLFVKTKKWKAEHVHQQEKINTRIFHWPLGASYPIHHIAGIRKNCTLFC